MSHTLLHTYRYLEHFSCLGEACEDTCCKGWGMQVDEPTFSRYKKEAPELLDAVTSGEAEHIMRRDSSTDYCVKFDNGLCGIHKSRGTKFLGDACHFYPRITRKFGEEYVQTAALSCPEIARITLYEKAPFASAKLETDRLPSAMNDYLPPEISAADAQFIIQSFLDACNDSSVTAERVLMRIVSASHSLEYIAKKDWREAAPFTLQMSEFRLPPAEVNFSDGYHLIQILEALVGASKAAKRPQLDAVRESILKTLDITVTLNNYEIISNNGDLSTYEKCWKEWQQKRGKIDGVLKRWLQAELAMAMFPFSGFGRNLPERALILAVRFATLRLALMCAPSLEQEHVVRVAQTLSRFLDHLADPELSVLAYKEVGWHHLGRMRGLVMDV